jgi:hypothetical protein
MCRIRHVSKGWRFIYGRDVAAMESSHKKDCILDRAAI